MEKPQGDLDGKAHMHLLVNGERLLIPGILHVHLEEGLRIQFDVIADGVADIGGKADLPGDQVHVVARFVGVADGGDLGADGDLAGIPCLESGLKDAFEQTEAGLHGHPALRLLDLPHLAGDQVIDADEIGYEGVFRPLIEVPGGAQLLYLSMIDDCDPIG